MLACAAVPMANEEGSAGSLPVRVTSVERGVGLAGMPPQRGKRFFRTRICSCADCIGATMTSASAPGCR